MRKHLLMLAVAATMGPATLLAQDPTDLATLDQRGDVYLSPGTSEPFSGPVVRMWTTDRVMEQGTLKDGRWDGTRETFYYDGEVRAKESFRDGVLHGPYEAYFNRGQLSDRGTYKDGVLDGFYEAYWVRGTPAERGSWTEGERCGQWFSFGITQTHPPCPDP